MEYRYKYKNEEEYNILVNTLLNCKYGLGVGMHKEFYSYRERANRWFRITDGDLMVFYSSIESNVVDKKTFIKHLLYNGLQLSNHQ